MAKEKKPPKEKPTPKRCLCGSVGIVVKMRGKKMVSCPDPLNCPGNFRTPWMSSEDDAIITWNNMEKKL